MRSTKQRRLLTFIVGMIPIAVIWTAAFILASPTANTTDTLPTIAALPDTALNQQSVSSESVAYVEGSSTKDTDASAVIDEPVADASDEPVPTDEPEVNTPPEEPVPDQMVITFPAELSASEREAYIASIGGTVVKEIPALNTVVINVSSEIGTSADTSNTLFASEPDYYVVALQDGVNDPLFSQQWALTTLEIPSAWREMAEDAPQVTVAVIDSGVCLDHPDLAGRIAAGYDFVQQDSTPQDDYGHGCGVAGIIAANGNNAQGLAGVAPNAVIMPLRVLNGQGVGQYSDVAAAIVYAADNGAQIINLSLGGAYSSTVLESAIDYAVAQGVMVIAAAGNTGGSVLYPAAYAPVVAVGSVDQSLQRSSFSSFGPEIDLYAPGRDIVTTKNDNTYGMWNGTSFAAPQVAGVAALEIAFGRTLTLGGGLVSLSTSGTSVAVQPTPTTPPPAANTSTFTGRIQIWIGDPPPGSNTPVQTMIALLDDTDGTLLALLSMDYADADRLEGQLVQVTGQTAGQAQSGQGTTIPTIIVENIESISAEGLADVNAALFGSFPYINVLCQFNGNFNQPEAPSWYPPMFSSDYPGLNHYWQEISYGNLNIDGTSTINQWLMLPYARTYYRIGENNYNLSLMAQHCASAAESLVDFTNYYGINFMFNDDMDCCAWGGATYIYVDGQWRVISATWLPPWAQQYDTLAHEMGHAFGLPHSSGPSHNPPSDLNIYVSQWDTMSVASGTCVFSNIDYGCIPPSTIAYHLDLEGWIPPAQRITVNPGTTTTITLERTNLPASSSNYLIARIPIGGSSTHFYTVEARQTVGYDQNVPANAVLIHQVDTARTGNTGPALVVDGDTNNNVNDAGAIWLPGETYFDALSNIRIEVLSALGSTFTVRISNGVYAACGFNIAASDTAALISAINTANSTSGTADTICLTNSTYEVNTINNTDDGANGFPVITSDITILGNGSSIWRFSGAPALRFFKVAANGRLTLDSVTLSNGIGGLVTEFSSDGGGAIYNQGSLTIIDSTLIQNDVGVNGVPRGGAIAAYQGNTGIINSVISANEAQRGGAIYNENPSSSTGFSLVISSSTFDNNQANEGGAVYHQGSGNVNISNSALRNNIASGYGGAFFGYPQGANLIAITHSCIAGNVSPNSSGVYNGNPVSWLNATYNWWSVPSGPGGFGGGGGDAINDYVDYLPYRNSPVAGCPSQVANDLSTGAYAISSLPYTNIQDVFGVGVDSNEPTPSCAPVANTVWYVYTPAFNESVEFNTFSSYYDTVLGVYQGTPGSWTELFCNDDYNLTSLQSRVTFTAEAGQTYYIMVGKYGSDAQWAGHWLYLNARTFPPSNDNIATPITVSAMPYTNTQSMLSASVATSPADPAMSCAASRSRTVWYSYQPTESRTIIADTLGSNLDTVMAVYTGTPGALTQVACNDDSGGDTSSLQFNALANTRYYIMIAEFGTGPGVALPSLTLNLQAIAPLVFNSPTGTVTTGYGNPTYEWTDVQGAQYYYLVVSNSAGTQIINEVLSDAGYCNGTTCSIDPTTLRENYRLVNGTYRVSMNTWSNDGMGIWRGPFTFTLNAAVPDVVTLSAPTNTNLLRPTFNWSLTGNAANATYFNVLASPIGNASAPVLNQWFSRSAACGSPTSTNCTLLSPIDLADNTNYAIYIRSYGPGGISTGGVGGYAGPQNFLLDAPAPNLPSGVAVNNNQGRATFSWNNDPNATYFNVYVTNNAGVSQHNAWYARSEVCPTSTCSITPVLALANGTYNLRIKAYGPGGLSTGGTANDGYSGPTPFVFNFAAPNINEIVTFAPTGTITTGAPTFTWNTVAGTTYYLLWVGGTAPSYTPIYQTWHDANVICTPHPGTCTVANAVTLPVGPATWRIQAYGPGGVSAIYNNPAGIPITVSGTLPPALTLNSPTGTIDVTAPAFVWQDNANVDYYNVYINSGATVVLNQWYRAERGVGKLCNAGVCSLNNAVTLANGNYTWNVRGYGPVGVGPFATGMNFTVTIPAPSAPLQTAPADAAIISTTNRPTFMWNLSPYATFYHLEVKNGMGTVVFDQWYGASTGGCTLANCTVQMPNPIAYGAYTWRVQAYSPGGLGAFSPTRSFFSLSISTMPLMVQADANTVQRGGTWNTTANELAVGQSYLMSSGSTSDTLTFGFTGTEAQVVYIAGAQFGSFVIEVDGVPMQAINAYAAQTSVGNLARITGLSEGTHTLRIIPLGGAPVAIDGVIVTSAAVITETLPPPSPTIVVPTVTVTEEVTPTPEITETPVATETPTDTPVPTVVPTEAPTAAPTEVPTEAPTAAPTEVPTEIPTETPTP